MEWTDIVLIINLKCCLVCGLSKRTAHLIGILFKIDQEIKDRWNEVSFIYLMMTEGLIFLLLKCETSSEWNKLI